MKRNYATLLGIGLITLAASAVAMGPGGGCGRGGGPGGPNIAMMDYALDLTDAQKQQIQDLRDQYADSRQRPAFAGKGVLMDLDPSDPNYQASVDSLANAAAENARQRVKQRAEMQAKMREILTPEQLAKWQEIRADMQANGGGRGQGRGWQ
ncbi:Spy/CpxP family protein refolding chaperone [Alteromonadaceae bacterium 2753L.S.0a.02]|nr:Spy/CpxP family protein refolding chaperone [Alteromonadaceae bacterium 2753L.S.0a.02]